MSGKTSDATPRSGSLAGDFAAAVPLAVVSALCAAISCAWVLNTDERGTAFGVLPLFVVGAFFIGLPFGIGGVGELLRHWVRDRRLPFRFVLAAAVGLPILFLPLTSVVGKDWYAADQIAAKAFVERRIGSIRADGAAWPKTQAEFVGSEPLPRMLRGRSFYSFDGQECQIAIPVDFDGGWFWRSERGEWHRTS